MMETKHTPGPWFNGTDPRQIESSIDGFIVATVSGALSNESVLADARLIAAAPAMLEFLIKLRDNSTFYHSAIEMDHGVDAEELETEMLNLIAQIKGEPNAD